MVLDANDLPKIGKYDGIVGRKQGFASTSQEKSNYETTNEAERNCKLNVYRSSYRIASKKVH